MFLFQIALLIFGAALSFLFTFLVDLLLQYMDLFQSGIN